ncbi:hypothetical protein KM043_008263 [Ampulex compressa]|nr:hypothetical protein KM043_008263 [Ampulex compressa]
MAFAAARMILKDKRRKASKEDFAPRNRSKVETGLCEEFVSRERARETGIVPLGRRSGWGKVNGLRVPRCILMKVVARAAYVG